MFGIGIISDRSKLMSVRLDEDTDENCWGWLRICWDLFGAVVAHQRWKNNHLAATGRARTNRGDGQGSGELREV